MIRELAKAIFIALVIGFIFKGLDKYGGIETMKLVFQTFVIELWPMWLGVAAALIYWFVRFQMKIYKLYRYLGTEVGNRVEKLENRNLKYDARIRYLEKVSAKMWDIEKAMEELKSNKEVK
jgi:hypothetical protein